MRRRNRENEKLPPYVYKRQSCYVVGAYDSETQKTRYKRLCGSDASLNEIWQAYDAFNKTDTDSFTWLTNKYFKSGQFKQLGIQTQRGYEKNAKTILQTKLKSGNLFGEIPLKLWTKPAIRKYMDKRAETAPVSANREKAFISLVFSWGLERGYCDDNPAKGVRRITEKSRTRYVTDGEYHAVISMAEGKYIAPAMELAYLLRARLCEVLDLTTDSLTDEGVLLIRRKGSRDSMNQWTPRLRKAVVEAKKFQRNRFNSHLIQGSDGRLRESALQTAWKRMMSKYIAAGGEHFTFHDLKAKGISDTDGDKKKASGHKTDAMVDVYDRKITTIKPTK